MSKWSRFRTDWQRWGFWSALYMRPMARLRPWLVIWRVHVRSLADTPGPAEPTDLPVRIASEEDLRQAAADPESGISEKFLSHAIPNGDICAGVFDNGRMVSYVWRTFTEAPFHRDRHCNLWIRVQAPYRYGYKALTLPQYRGRKLQDHVITLSDNLCMQRGRTLGVGAVETHNMASLRSDLRRGNNLVGYIGLLHIGARTFTFSSKGAKGVGIDLYPGPE